MRIQEMERSQNSTKPEAVQPSQVPTTPVEASSVLPLTMLKAALNHIVKTDAKAIDPFGRDAFYDTYLPARVHMVSKVAINGTSVEIEDGSQWKVARGYEDRVIRWASDDVLDLYFNEDWIFPASKFYLYNRNTGEYAPVDLQLGPYVQSPYTQELSAMNLAAGLVETCDSERATSWRISPSDRKVIADWQASDAIIVGSYYNFFSSNDSFLINVETNEVILAKEL